jgi:cyclopropane fatty-acyl-phospholipid synthase-like methyltransferase
MKSLIFGNDTDRMPDFAFRMMSILFKLADIFSPKGHYIDGFGIKPGYTVMDYGCGPGRHIKRASQLAGSKGTVYATDIHELAIASVEKLIRRKGLSNVRAILSRDMKQSIAPKTVNLVYALDMFHMVIDTDSFLKGIHRIIMTDGILILEDGHQPRTQARKKVMQSGCWDIMEETGRHMKCAPRVVL